MHEKQLPVESAGLLLVRQSEVGVNQLQAMVIRAVVGAEGATPRFVSRLQPLATSGNN